MQVSFAKGDTELKVLVVNSIATNDYNESRTRQLLPVMNQGTRLEMVSIENGFTSLEYLNEEMVNVIDTVEKVAWGEKNGFHGVLINCFFDPGLYEAREQAKIPVVGAGEAAMFIASRLGHKFAILATSPKSIPKIERKVHEYNLGNSVSGVISLGIGVPRLQQEGLSDEIEAILKKQIDMAIQGGAECITVGCTAALGIGELLADLSPVPIVDPSIVGVKVAEMLASLYKLTGLSHSKIGAFSYK